MESVMTKIILISLSLLTVALLFYAYTRTYHTYSSVHDLIERVNDNRLNRYLTTMYCFLNSTSGNVEVHIFNYGEADESHKIAIFFEKSDSSFVKVFDDYVNFPSATMSVVEFAPPETLSEFNIVIIWVDTGEIENVGCVGP